MPDSLSVYLVVDSGIDTAGMQLFFLVILQLHLLASAICGDHAMLPHTRCQPICHSLKVGSKDTQCLQTGISKTTLSCYWAQGSWKSYICRISNKSIRRGPAAVDGGLNQ